MAVWSAMGLGGKALTVGVTLTAVSVGGYLVYDSTRASAVSDEQALNLPDAAITQAPDPELPRSIGADGTSASDTVPETVSADLPQPPQFDLVRVDPRGSTIIAGQAAPSSRIVVLVDGEEAGDAQVDGGGNFVFMFDLQPSALPRIITLEMQVADGLVIESHETVLLGPTPGYIPAPELAELIDDTPPQATADIAALPSAPAPSGEAPALDRDTVALAEIAGPLSPVFSSSTPEPAPQADRAVPRPRLDPDEAQRAEIPLEIEPDFAIAALDPAFGEEAELPGRLAGTLPGELAEAAPDGDAPAALPQTGEAGQLPGAPDAGETGGLAQLDISAPDAPETGVPAQPDPAEAERELAFDDEVPVPSQQALAEAEPEVEAGDLPELDADSALLELAEADAPQPDLGPGELGLAAPVIATDSGAPAAPLDAFDAPAADDTAALLEAVDDAEFPPSVASAIAPERPGIGDAAQGLDAPSAPGADSLDLLPDLAPQAATGLAELQDPDAVAAEDLDALTAIAPPGPAPQPGAAQADADAPPAAASEPTQPVIGAIADEGFAPGVITPDGFGALVGASPEIALPDADRGVPAPVEAPEEAHPEPDAPLLAEAEKAPPPTPDPTDRVAEIAPDEVTPGVSEFPPATDAGADPAPSVPEEPLQLVIPPAAPDDDTAAIASLDALSQPEAVDPGAVDVPGLPEDVPGAAPTTLPPELELVDLELAQPPVAAIRPDGAAQSVPEDGPPPPAMSRPGAAAPQAGPSESAPDAPSGVSAMPATELEGLELARPPAARAEVDIAPLRADPDPGPDEVPDETPAAPADQPADPAPIAPAPEIDGDAPTHMATPDRLADDGPSMRVPTPEAAPPVVESGGSPSLVLSTDEGVRVLQPAAPLSAPEVMDNVAVETITYSPEGNVVFAGRAQGDGAVLLYLDNELLETIALAGDGQWHTELPQVDAGVYTLRVDQVDRSGAVVSRFETPFQREDPILLASRMDPVERGARAEVVTVQPGFTLWGISRAAYGRGIMYVQVFEANRDHIRSPDLIYPGQVIVLPESGQ